MKLTVVMLDRQRTRFAIVYENQSVPYGKRTVQIELTPEQLEMIRPRKVGTEGGVDVFEEIGEHWLE